MSPSSIDHSSADLLRTGFSVRTEDRDGVVVLRLKGDLDQATAVDLRRALAEALEKEPPALALDLTELAFVDSSGIGLLVGASRRAKESGCSFVLRSPVRPVQKVLELTGVSGLIEPEQADTP